MASQSQSSFDQSKIDKPWLDLLYHDSGKTSIKKPAELESDMQEPPGSIDEKILDRIQGSIVGMALGDALGAHVEFRPQQYMVENPVTDLEGGGTWGLQKGQFTDDTSMALCLANSLVAQSKFNPYDQLVRYKWWYKYGYMSSIGECFDIGAATSQSLNEFERRQDDFAKKHRVPHDEMDFFSNEELLDQFDVCCSEDGVAGNGALMRLAPVPLFFYRSPSHAVEYSGRSGQITHGDRKAYDACRYYGALIVAALQGYSKDELLDKQFYSKHKQWFNGKPLCTDIKLIAEGSYQKPGGYEDGIRGKGYIVNALEAALWAFWSDDNSFEKGALAAVNLGDDTDTTAAIYGQLAGAYYGYKKLPRHWLKHVYAKKFMINLSRWIAYEGQMWQPSEIKSPFISNSSLQSSPNEKFTEKFEHELDSNMNPSQSKSAVPVFSASKNQEKPTPEKVAVRRSRGPTTSESSQYQSIAAGPPSRNRPPVNPDHIDSHSKYQSQPPNLDTHLTLKKSDSNKQQSQTLQPIVPSSNLSGKPKTLSPDNRAHGPLLRPTKSISNAEQVFLPSTGPRNYGITTDHNKEPHFTFETSSHTNPDKILLKKTSSERTPSQPTPSVPAANIPEPASSMLPNPDNSKSRHRISDVLSTFRRHPRLSTSSMQVPVSNTNGSTSPRLVVDKSSSSKSSRHDQKHQSSTDNRSPYTSRSSYPQISTNRSTKLKSSTQYSDKTSDKNLSYI